VHVVPYSYTLPPAAATGLERLVRSVWGANASLTVVAPVAYGGEDALAASAPPESAVNVIALFNAAATPERETHGAFLDRLAAQQTSGGMLVALVDESALRDRWGSEPARLEQRRAGWRALCNDRRAPCAFAALASPEPGDAAAELERVLDEAAK
jgi:hypothetical protein